ncbi:MAG: HAD-IA family hydrolase [Chitinivibrionales bacterium]|nr:HAD-IA family hydrolase [Chitinivibrionales bacterium]
MHFPADTVGIITVPRFSMPIKAVVFDLDDTLSDHRYSSMQGVRALQQRYAPLAQYPLEQLAARHFALLNEWHLRILQGSETVETARPKRYRAFLQDFGVRVTDSDIPRAIEHYHAAYLAHRRAVPGVVAVIDELRRRQVPLAVLTNHHSLTEQRGKLDECGLSVLSEQLFVSADIGFTKPEPGAFVTVLDDLGCRPADAVMVGDSLHSDIEGALAAGMHAVWLNRDRTPRPEGLVAHVLETFEPWRRSVEVIVHADRQPMKTAGQTKA